MRTIEVLTLLAILLGPILAIQIQKRIETHKEIKDRKLNIFKSLMATRGARVSFEHVRALNMIDIEFTKHKDIAEAWKYYLDCLCNSDMVDGNLQLWANERDKLFVDLMNKMGTALGYHFDKVHLKKSIYTPIAHNEEEIYQLSIREQLKKIFNGEQSISVKIENSDQNMP